MTENEAIKCLEKQIQIQPCGNVALALEISIKALEEIQQYRAIGTVEGYENAIKIVNQLAGEYKDAEEQGLLKILPVAIDSDVYFIPSKVNYELNVLHKHEENNRVYHQQVANIVFSKRGWYLECNLDLAYGTDHILVDKLYKETWFTSQEEAEQALAEMKGV